MNGRYPEDRELRLRGVPAVSWMMDILGLQLLAWALGMSVTIVLLDSAADFVRDHPPFAWRITGAATGPMALISFVSILACGAPLWLSLAVVLPFALLNLVYSWAWVHRCSAEMRRKRGREALFLGVITVLFVSLEQGVSEPQSVLVLAAFAGSAALLGGLGTLMLIALLGGRRDEVAVPFTPYGIPARMVATGLAVTLLALLDSGFGLLLGGKGFLTTFLALWVAFSLLVPLGLMAAGHRLFPRWQSPIWATAFGSVLVGQLALQAALSLG